MRFPVLRSSSNTSRREAASRTTTTVAEGLGSALMLGVGAYSTL
jgi:hypothetical protein